MIQQSLRLYWLMIIRSCETGVKGFLETQPDFQVVGEADSGEGAIKLVEELVPDIVLMDLVMPGMGGVEATARIKQASPHTQVVVLTSYHDDIHIFPAIKAGALSYLLKDIRPDELAVAVRAAAIGEAVINPRVAARLVKELRSDKETSNPFLALTEREKEVLYLIAEGLSNIQISQKLVLSEKTIKGHVSNILGKLHLGDRTQAAVFAWKQGVVEKRPPDLF